MELPETAMLNFFNKVLLTLVELSAEDRSCSIKKVINTCKLTAIGGIIGDYDLVIAHCKFVGLITIKGHNVILSTLGNKFLSANKLKYIEVTEGQKQITAERIVFKGAWSNHARDLFDHFSANPLTSLYEVSMIEGTLSKKHEPAIHFFKHLGILQQAETIITVNKRYSQLVYELTADGKAIAEQQLEQLLMENRKLGAQAENIIVEFEKQRLLKLGKSIQSDLVKRISTINSAAGYDIESFDGNNNDVFPNRFIEVKATTGNEIRFYWTINERNVAKVIKDNYWIYVLVGFREDDPHRCIPIKIQNPENVIPSHHCFAMDVSKYIINEIAEVKLVAESLDEVKWFKLT